MTIAVVIGLLTTDGAQAASKATSAPGLIRVKADPNAPHTLNLRVSAVDSTADPSHLGAFTPLEPAMIGYASAEVSEAIATGGRSAGWLRAAGWLGLRLSAVATLLTQVKGDNALRTRTSDAKYVLVVTEMAIGPPSAATTIVPEGDCRESRQLDRPDDPPGLQVTCDINRDVNGRVDLQVSGGRLSDGIDLQAVSCAGAPCFNNLEADASAGRDTINGSPQDDELTGGLGSDSVYGLDGNDTLLGDLPYKLTELQLGHTLPQYAGHISNDYLDGGNGRDRIAGSWGNDLIIGGRGDDNLTLATTLGTVGQDYGQDFSYLGGPADLQLSGGAGDDVIVGGTGVDGMRGDAGNDTVLASEADYGTTNGLRNSEERDNGVDCGPSFGLGSGNDRYRKSPLDPLTRCGNQLSIVPDWRRLKEWGRNDRSSPWWW